MPSAATTDLIDAERLAKITTLKSGKHSSPRQGMCVMEAVAYVRRLPHSDHPPCVSPVIGAFLRSWNDALPDAERTALLLPLIPRVVNTTGSAALEERRALMAADWLVRVNTPAWLRLAGLTIHADALAALPEITSLAQVPSIRGPIEAARIDAAAARAAAWAAARAAAWAAAGAAAWDAAGDAARAAAWAAAGAAAWDAAGDAARAAAGDAAADAAWDAAAAAAWAAAGDAARAAAGDAAGDAARAAAWAAAGDAARAAAWAAARAAARAAANKKLAPVKAELQQSALALIERMIGATDQAEAA